MAVLFDFVESICISCFLANEAFDAPPSLVDLGAAAGGVGFGYTFSGTLSYSCLLYIWELSYSVVANLLLQDLNGHNSPSSPTNRALSSLFYSYLKPLLDLNDDCTPLSCLCFILA